ncbi:transmembrane protein 65-like isoform X2 [Pollicipes pollicipes]|uniref:transmembrane protein 65-like isoform X2 n=1 Tax=Pollicipes pollicipes TaxID=41117 RepID=UPI00188501AD|nr:transmembrane protein 65-like isoform X2 [Pollicipes pollicipes]
MGSITRGVLFKVATSQSGRKAHKPLLGKNASGCLASCLRLDLNTQAPLDEKTLARATQDGSSAPRLRLTKESARNLARNFTADDRQLLLSEIQQIKGDEAIMEFSATSVPKPTPGQLIHTALFNSIPFIGFGFLDNVIMITAGDYIEASVGVAFSISTMAAAALGNAVSDVAGIGSAFYVEVLAMRIGVPAPSMTPEQHDLKISHWFSNIGRAFGVAFGCILGMFPLFFLPGHNKTEKDEEDEATAAAAEATGAVGPVVKAEAPPAAAASTTATSSQSDTKPAASVQTSAEPAAAPSTAAAAASAESVSPRAAPTVTAEPPVGRESSPKLVGEPK